MSVQRKADHTLVTRADREVEKLVRERLVEITPVWPVLGEEVGEGGREIDRKAPFWVVNPVDGTSQFINGLPTWFFSLGLIDSHRARFRIIELPMIGEHYYTDPMGEIVYLNGEKSRWRGC